MKDSKNSYEQRKWESAVKQHAAWKKMLTTLKFESSRAEVQRRIDMYEMEFPQLKS